MYNHQYQTNIAAPSSESLTTYNAYKKQGFLDLQFTFNIPIFNNMADKYDRYVGYDNLGTKRPIKNLVDNIEDSHDDNHGSDKVGSAFLSSYQCT